MPTLWFKSQVLAVAVVAMLASVAALAQALPGQALASLAALLQSDLDGFAPTGAPWPYSFPRDHAAHPDHRTELWRFSGNLATHQGERFGFQLTFLRAAIVPPAAPLGPSSFAAREAYWANFVVSDAQAKRRYEFEQLVRVAMQLAGAQTTPIRVWAGRWSMQVENAGGTHERFRLRAEQEGVALELHLRAVKAPVTRSAREATASRFHGYLLSRLTAQGTIRIGSRSFEVAGPAWADRAWGEVPLPVGAVVWDRFLLQFDDGRELMALRLRRRDDSGEPLVSALLVMGDGEARDLGADELEIEPLGQRWRVRLPAEQAEIVIEADVPQSGPARVTGTAHGRPLAGEGYIETAGSHGR